MQMKTPPYRIPPLSDFKVTRTIHKKEKKELPYPYQFVLQQQTTWQTT